jgi:hypothetical protein
MLLSSQPILLKLTASSSRTRADHEEGRAGRDQALMTVQIHHSLRAGVEQKVVPEVVRFNYKRQQSEEQNAMRYALQQKKKR